MNRLAFQVKIFFIILFALITAGLYIYQAFWVQPGLECEKSGRWWHNRTRECGIPIRISDITGRHMEDMAPTMSAPPPVPAAQSAAPAAKTAPGAPRVLEPVD